MKHWDELRDTLCRELDEIAEKGELSAGDLETVDKLTHTMKNLDKIMMGEGYSSAGDWYAMGNYGRDSYRPDYRDGISYRGRRRAGGNGREAAAYDRHRAGQPHTRGAGKGAALHGGIKNVDRAGFAGNN